MPDPADKPVVTRFAPSPTGALHIGGARTALFAWAYARKHKAAGGRFILRLEDTDKKRSSKESARGIIRDLGWLGLDWDEGPSPDDGADPYTDQLGDNGPYTQTQRAEQGIYDHYVQLLLDAGEAYEDGGAVRLKMGSHRGDIAFDDAVYGTVTVKADDNEDFVIRKGDDGGRLPTFHFAVVCDDALMGVTHVIRGQEHLSNTTKHAAIYDALAKLTNDPVTWARPVWVHTPSIMNPGGSKMSKRDKAKVARDATKEWISQDNHDIEKLIIKVATAIALKDGPLNQSALNNYLYEEWIDFELSGDGYRISPGGSHKGLVAAVHSKFDMFMKKENDSTVLARDIARVLGVPLPEIEVNDFRRSGYLPSALLNYIALLGWNPGNDVERFDTDFLCERFDFKRIGKANSTFDRDKLRAFNGDTIRELSPEEFAYELGGYVKAYRSEWRDHGLFNGDDWQAFCAAVQERAETLAQPLDANGYLIDEEDAIEYDFSPKPMRKAMINSDGAGIQLLEELRAAFDGLPEENFGHAAHAKINELAEASGINMGKYAQPVRIAVSGGPVTPPLDVTLDLLGKSAVLRRIDRCLEIAKEYLQSST